MPATPARIALISQPTRNVVATAPTMKTLFGSAARDTATDPVQTFFQTTADAQQAANERISLIGALRRRHAITVDGIENLDYLAASQTHVRTVRVVDAELGVDGLAMVGSLTPDLEQNQITITTWG